MAIQVKEAVGVAEAYVRELYSDVKYTLLEEVELAEEDGKELWKVTLSFQFGDDPLRVQPSPAETLARSMTLEGTPQPRLPKHYKVLSIDAETGEVKSMKIRHDSTPD